MRITNKYHEIKVPDCLAYLVIFDRRDSEKLCYENKEFTGRKNRKWLKSYGVGVLIYGIGK